MQQLMTKFSGKLNKTETALSSRSLIPDGLFSSLNVLPMTAFEDVPSPKILCQSSLNLIYMHRYLSPECSLSCEHDEKSGKELNLSPPLPSSTPTTSHL